MKSATFFWLFAVLSLGALAGTLLGYTTLPVAVTLLFVTMVLLKASASPSKFVDNLRMELSSRIGSIESSMSGLTQRLEEEKGARDLTLGALDSIKCEMQTELKTGMDRMAERLIDFENGMNQMKRTFSAAVASLDDRVRAMEPRMSADGAPIGPNMQPSENMVPEVEEYIELDKPSAQ
jgi:hypothetical protein